MSDLTIDRQVDAIVAASEYLAANHNDEQLALTDLSNRGLVAVGQRVTEAAIYSLSQDGSPGPLPVAAIVAVAMYQTYSACIRQPEAMALFFETLGSESLTQASRDLAASALAQTMETTLSGFHSIAAAIREQSHAQ